MATATTRPPVGSPSRRREDIQVYGAWLCGNDTCAWATRRSVSDFDLANHWLIDRGDGQPSVNLVVFAFVNPLKLLRRTSDGKDVDGVPVGITPELVNYFRSRHVRVMLSLGGYTYTDAWNQALQRDPEKLARHAARLALRLHAGIEIDYEEGHHPHLLALNRFVHAYRSFRDPATGATTAYDPAGVNPASRLTIDLGNDDYWLSGIAAYASAHWLQPGQRMLDYANLMVPDKPVGLKKLERGWRQHVAGDKDTSPPVPALAPARLTVGLYLTHGKKILADCDNFARSMQRKAAPLVLNIPPRGAGKTAGLLGYMFWAAECPTWKGTCTTPPHGCEGGVGQGARRFQIPVPMRALPEP